MIVNRYFGRLLMLLVFVFVANCNDPDANDCFQTTGDQFETTLQLPEFNRILVGRNIEAFIQEDSQYAIRIVTGENLFNGISVFVEGDQLIIEDSNTCNFIRDYGTTKVFISSPDIREIRSSTQFKISSVGPLNYPDISLISEDFNNSDALPLAEFTFDLNAERLTVVSNSLSNFYISGSVNQLSVGFFNGVGRFEGEDLLANKVEVSHRGSNDIIVNPQESIIGVIRGTGDVIAVNRPAIVDVDQLYTGQLIIND